MTQPAISQISDEDLLGWVTQMRQAKREIFGQTCASGSANGQLPMTMVTPRLAVPPAGPAKTEVVL